MPCVLSAEVTLAALNNPFSVCLEWDEGKLASSRGVSEISKRERKLARAKEKSMSSYPGFSRSHPLSLFFTRG